MSSIRTHDDINTKIENAIEIYLNNSTRVTKVLRSIADQNYIYAKNEIDSSKQNLKSASINYHSFTGMTAGKKPVRLLYKYNNIYYDVSIDADGPYIVSQKY